MSFNELLKDIKESRFGRKMDPCWLKYHQWSKKTFPISLPVCTVTHLEKNISFDDRAIIKCILHDDIAIVIRVDSEDGQILKEILPVPVENSNSGEQFSTYTINLDQEILKGKIGIGFEWVFNIPVKPPGHYQPTKPLGVVILDKSELLGKEFEITVSKS